MTFFEEELRRIADMTAYIEEPKIVGRSCIFRLTENITGKLTLTTCGMADKYEALKIDLINRNEGCIDTQYIQFVDVWGKMPFNSDFISPYAWTSYGKTEWYCVQPENEQYELLSEKVDEYLECFIDPVEVMDEELIVS
ncbi:MAG: hypothetical protein KBA55_10850 [Ruminococcus sp.]|nr:hypothetical protein [Ruminococcus sp.]